ncbi:THAP domain-containing protein 2 [Cyphomyrmex costatus]|uniref:THAP domain-containing protein 2 n=1 Tax=Cyphomyrmex costatus TaxID=456900 RepID=A0A195C2K3_9HYME|nr:THAP domain-containing protein 2 [Cyphomyrmex costatus]
MVKNCCVQGCNASWRPDVDLSFFSFPLKNEDLLKEWLQIVPINNQISKHSRICSIHFEESQYECISGKRFLRKNAVPTIFPQDIAQFKKMIAKVEKLYPKYQNVVLESVNSNNNSHDHCYSKLHETFLISSVLNETDKAIQTTPQTKSVGTQTSSRATEKEKELRYRIKSLQSKLRRKELKELKNMRIPIKYSPIKQVIYIYIYIYISGSFKYLNCSGAYIESYYFVQYSLEHHRTLLKLYYSIPLDHILNHIIPILIFDNISLMFCTMVEIDDLLLPGTSEICKSPDQ